MPRLRTQGPLAPAVASALVRGDSDATEGELEGVERSVLESIEAMPDTLRFGVNGVSLLAGGALTAMGGGAFRGLPADTRTRLARRLSTLPVPGMAEFVRLTRGLGLVSLYEDRATGSEPERPVSQAG